MLSQHGQKILDLLSHRGAMEGPDIEQQMSLSEEAIKSAAVELRAKGFITTSGAPNANEDGGMAIDKLTITPAGNARRVID